MILKVKDENGHFKEVILKGTRGERGEKGEDGTVLQQKEIDDIKSSLDNMVTEIINVKNPPNGLEQVKGVGDEDETDKIAATLTLIVNDIQAEKLVAAEYSGKLHAIFEKRGN